MKTMLDTLDRDNKTVTRWYNKAVNQKIIPSNSLSVFIHLKQFQKAEKIVQYCKLKSVREKIKWQKDNKLDNRNTITAWKKLAISFKLANAKELDYTSRKK